MYGTPRILTGLFSVTLARVSAVAEVVSMQTANRSLQVKLKTETF
jgi:hypothetical protein